MITQYDKAIAALVVGALVIAAGHFGFHLTTEVQAAFTTIATAVVVYLVPNKQ